MTIISARLITRGTLLISLMLPHAGQARPHHATTGDSTTGIASWYGWREHGRGMANGHPFNALGRTAASRTLALGDCVRVTRLANRRSVVLRITDRGPHARLAAGRDIDLSLGAAMRLRMIKDGLARVRIDRLARHRCRG